MEISITSGQEPTKLKNYCAHGNIVHVNWHYVGSYLNQEWKRKKAMSNIYLDPKEVLLKSADKQKQSDFSIQAINHIFVCVLLWWPAPEWQSFTWDLNICYVTNNCKETLFFHPFSFLTTCPCNWPPSAINSPGASHRFFHHIAG